MNLLKGFLIAQHMDEWDLLYYSFSIVKKIYESYNASLLGIKPANNCTENGLNWPTGAKFYE